MKGLEKKESFQRKFLKEALKFKKKIDNFMKNRWMKYWNGWKSKVPVGKKANYQIHKLLFDLTCSTLNYVKEREAE